MSPSLFCLFRTAILIFLGNFQVKNTTSVFIYLLDHFGFQQCFGSGLFFRIQKLEPQLEENDYVIFSTLNTVLLGQVPPKPNQLDIISLLMDGSGSGFLKSGSGFLKSGSGFLKSGSGSAKKTRIHPNPKHWFSSCIKQFLGWDISSVVDPE